MDAGRLKHRITIQRRKTGQRPSGQLQKADWEDVCTVWAEAKCKASGAANGEGVTTGEMVYRFYIRWRSDIDRDMRILWKGRTFELTGPPVDWEHEKVGLTLLAREVG